MNIKVNNVDVLILCGGLGTRFAPISKETPKSLADINGRPFLDLVIDKLQRHGFCNVILCVGHLKNKIIDRYKDCNSGRFRFSIENEPLGTGGALIHALPLCSNDMILVVNGDSICDVNLNKVLVHHINENSDMTIVCSEKDERRDTGGVCIDSSSMNILSFEEKVSQSNCYVNAGIYLIKKTALEMFSAGKYSLEKELIPYIVKNNVCKGFLTKEKLIDIGTPERYKNFLKRFYDL
jgi:NDP-sugar pyrophosphorylase family protein